MFIVLLLALAACLQQAAAGCSDWSTALADHNRLRKLHNAPALVWTSTLQSTAQSRANALAAANVCKLGSSGRAGYGENVFCSSLTTPSCSQAVKAWYSQVQAYRWTSTPYTNNAATALSVVNQFTQAVWAGSTQVGCGGAVAAKGCTYVVCMYSAAGNVKSDSAYKSHVKPVVSTSVTSVPLPLATRTATTSAGTTCKDTSQWCPYWTPQYCSDSWKFWDKTVPQLCPQSCRRCSTSTTRPPAPPCVDSAQWCSDWAAGGYCKDSYRWGDKTIPAWCPLSCGTCNGRRRRTLLTTTSVGSSSIGAARRAVVRGGVPTPVYVAPSTQQKQA